MSKNKPVILFRKFKGYEDELKIASKYFDVYESIMDIPHDSLVLGRYSVIPYYNELERDLAKINSKLVNSYFDHQYISEMGYVLDLEDVTPKTYFSPNDLPLKDNAYILKGKTNSRKEQWKDKMFARNKKDAISIYLELMNDPNLAEQGVVFREYLKLNKISESVNGMPFSNEWRFFFYKEELIEYNYYWSQSDIIPTKDKLNSEGIDFAKEIAKKVSSRVNFFVLDIAEKENGEWTLIEINDGQMSGLSEIDVEHFYSNLSKVKS